MNLREVSNIKKKKDGEKMENEIETQQKAGMEKNAVKTKRVGMTNKYYKWELGANLTADELVELRRTGRLVWFSEVEMRGTGIINYICSVKGDPSNVFEIDIMKYNKKIKEAIDKGFDGLLEIREREDGKRKADILMTEENLTKPQRQHTHDDIQLMYSSFDSREGISGHIEDFVYYEVIFKGRKRVQATGHMVMVLLKTRNSNLTVYFTIDTYLRRLEVSRIEFLNHQKV